MQAGPRKTPARRHAVDGRRHFAFSDVRHSIAKAAMDDNFRRLFPGPRKPVVNSLLDVLLCCLVVGVVSCAAVPEVQATRSSPSTPSESTSHLNFGAGLLPCGARADGHTQTDGDGPWTCRRSHGAAAPRQRCCAGRGRASSARDTRYVRQECRWYGVGDNPCRPPGG